MLNKALLYITLVTGCIIATRAIGDPTASASDQLVDFLQNRCRFLSSTRPPVIEGHDIINVTAKFALIGFNDIDDTAETMTVLGTLSMTWYYPPCANWDQDYPWNETVDSVYLDMYSASNQDALWTPPIWHTNNVNDIWIARRFILDSHGILLEKSGKATVLATGNYESYCDLSENMVRFPFDSHKCSISFQSWFPTSTVTVKNGGFTLWGTTSSEIPEGFVSPSSVWNLDGLNTSQGNFEYTYNTLDYTLHLTRKPISYWYTVFLPCWSLMLLQLAPFALPHTDCAERTYFSLTCVLSFYVTQTITSAIVPRSSMTLLIDVFVAAQIILSSLLTFYFAFDLRIKARYIGADGEEAKCKVFGYCCSVLNAIDLIAFTFTITLIILMNAFILSAMVWF